MVAAFGARMERARIGALVLAVTIVLPVAVSTAVYLTLDDQPHTDAETRFGFASLVLGVGLVASALGLLGLFAFTLFAPNDRPESVSTLRVLGVLRTAADAAAFGVLFAPSFQVWQSSVGLAIVEIVFTVSLLRFMAAVLNEHGAAGLARSSQQFVYVYAITRLLLLLVWVLPEHMKVLSALHRALAPLLDGVVALLLLKCAALLTRGSRGALPLAEAPPAA